MLSEKYQLINPKIFPKYVVVRELESESLNNERTAEEKH